MNNAKKLLFSFIAFALPSLAFGQNTQLVSPLQGYQTIAETVTLTNLTITGTLTISGTISGSGLTLVDSDTDTLSLDPSALNVIHYRDGATDLFVLDSTGQVGIGTASPGAELDVNGDIKLSGNNATLYTDGEYIRGVATTGEYHVDSRGSYVINLDANNNDATSGFKVRGDASATDLFFINHASGNVGIGTAASIDLDAAKFYVHAASGTTPSADSVAVFSNDGDATLDSAVVIAEDGHLEVKTTGPTFDVLIQDTGTGTASETRLTVANEGGTGNYLMLQKYAGTATGTTMGVNRADLAIVEAADQLLIRNASSSGDIYFAAGATDGNYIFNENSHDNDFRVESDNSVNAFFIEGSSGNVGIGTASPFHELEVEEAGSPVIQIDATASTGSGALVFADDNTTIGSVNVYNTSFATVARRSDMFLWADADISLLPGNAEKAILMSTGNFGLNGASTAEVASAMLYVDAATGTTPSTDSIAVFSNDGNATLDSTVVIDEAGTAHFRGKANTHTSPVNAAMQITYDKITGPGTTNLNLYSGGATRYVKIFSGSTTQLVGFRDTGSWFNPLNADLDVVMQPDVVTSGSNTGSFYYDAGNGYMGFSAERASGAPSVTWTDSSANWSLVSGQPTLNFNPADGGGGFSITVDNSDVAQFDNAGSYNFDGVVTVLSTAELQWGDGSVSVRGNSSGESLIFETNSADVMNINSSGDVAISDATGVLDFSGATSATISATGTGLVQIADGDNFAISAAESFHLDGGSNTRIREVSADVMQLEAGGAVFIELNEGASDVLFVNPENADIDLAMEPDVVTSGSNTGAFYYDAGSGYAGLSAERASGAPSVAWTDSSVFFSISSGHGQINFRAGDGDGANIDINTSDEITFNGAAGGYHYLNGGIVAGTPTGGNKGAGTVNANAVYDDDVLIGAPDYVFEPEYEMSEIAEMRQFYETYRHLPTLTSKVELEKRKNMSLGERLNEAIETIEVQAKYIAELNARLEKLERGK